MNVAENLVVAIMAGGSGTRFWPMSRPERPKQFLNLTGERTMLQVTFDRLQGLVPPERVLVLTNARFADLAREQLPELPVDNVIGEPMPRDTSGAVALAAALVERKWPGAILSILAADHTIEPASRFQEVLLGAAEAAHEEGGLYTFGIQPRSAATGYGYLEVGDAVGERRGAPIHKLAAFREKPDQETADAFLRSGRHLWNSGMFVWRTQDILAEIEKHLPAHHAAMTAVAQTWGTDAFADALREGFEPLPKVSIDFGVMEKAADVRCAVADFGWNDVGGWVALEQVLPRDEDGNWTQTALSTLDSRDNIVVSEQNGHRVVCIGVSDLIVVTTPNATLVCHKNEAERIKKVVESLPKP
ncbi:MAG: mannose-1-phosphate guanylyltransferase [Fibrobacteria bacterium]|nr:mannose-1-phosphate guanylyltransferase [Fibrobacteria bacterium]